MKQVFNLISILLVVYSTFGQSFEGKINYTNNYISKLPNVTSDQFNLMLGISQEYYIKNGNYKSITNGTFAQWQLYVNSENKVYSKFANSTSAIWNDAIVQGDEVIEVKINREVLEILGKKCDEIILICKSGIQKYYFSSKLGVDSTLFKNHKFGNWFDFISKSNSLPLKMIIENPQFTMTSIATSATETELQDSFFRIPEGMTTNKSPY